MLATMSDYLFPWQIPVYVAFVVGWIFGGGYLIRRSFKRHGASRRLSLGRGILASLLAGMAGAFAGGIIGAIVGTSILPVIGSVIFGLLGAFSGAVLAEYIQYEKLDDALKTGFWAFVGKLSAYFVKAALAMGVLAIFIVRSWR